MNAIEKTVALVALALLGVFFWAVWTARDAGVRLPEPCGVTAESFGEPRVATNADGRVQIFMQTYAYNYFPKNITVPAGKEVDLFLISKDVVHGLQIFKKNVNLMSVPGAVNYTKIKFDKAGSYELICNEYCGTSHQIMFDKITAL